MTVKVTFDPWMIYPEVSMETEDDMRAAMLPAETEIALRVRIWGWHQALLSLDMAGLPEEVAIKIQQYNFLKGKIEACTELLEASRDAKQRQSLGGGG